MSILRPSVDIVIVNWNAGDFLRLCLESILPARKAEFELKRVVVVDNASSDGFISKLAGLDLPLMVIRNMENKGFSAACNQGASSSEADYLLFLNPDTRLYPESLSHPIRFMESTDYSGVGICGVKLIGEDGEPTLACSRFPSLEKFTTEMFGLSKIFPNIFLSHIMSPKELMVCREVDQVIGAYFLIRKELFIQLGGFDERFFVYFEEVDLSLRAKKRGYSSYYLPDVTALHVGRACSRQASSMSLYYSLSSRLKYALKHFECWEAVALIFLTFTVEFIARILWAAVGSSVFGVGDVLSAYRHLAGSFISGE